MAHTPEHGISEIAGIPELVLAGFSQRTSDIEQRLGVKLERFRTLLGREPTVKERWRLEREAVLDSRPAKPHGPTLPELHEEWRERVQAMGLEPQLLVERMVGRQRRLEGIDSRRAAAIIDAGLDTLTAHQSSWRPAEMTRELAAAVPTTVGVDAARLTGFLLRLANHATVARCVDISRSFLAGVQLRRDGRPITEASVDRALTIRSILDEEEQLLAWAERRLQPRRVQVLN